MSARDRVVLPWWEVAAQVGQVIGVVALVVREFVVEPGSAVGTMTLVVASGLLVFAFLVRLVAARGRGAVPGRDPFLGQTCLLLGWCGIQWSELFRVESAAQYAVLVAVLLVLVIGFGAVVRATLRALRRDGRLGTGRGG